MFKFLIGIGIASGAVALQDQIPKFELRGAGTVSSTNKEAPAPPKEPKAKAVPKRAKAAGEPLLLHRYLAHKGEITKARFAMNGRRIVSAGIDGTIKIWDTESRVLFRTLELDDGPATALATRGNLALTGHSEGAIALWNLDTGVKLKSFKRNDAAIRAVTFAGTDERFWAAGHDWTVVLWETRTPSAPLQVLEGHGNSVQAITYSPAKALLASGGADKVVRLWNGNSMNQVRRYGKARDFVTALAFSPDGETLVAGLLNGQIRVMSTKRRRYRTLKAHGDAVVGLKFDADGNFISAGKDGRLKRWSTRRRRPLATFGGSGNDQVSMDVAPDGHRILSADKQGYVTIWRGKG